MPLASLASAVTYSDFPGPTAVMTLADMSGPSCRSVAHAAQTRVDLNTTPICDYVLRHNTR